MTSFYSGWYSNLLVSLLAFISTTLTGFVSLGHSDTICEINQITLGSYTIQQNLFKHSIKSSVQKKTKTDLQDCRVGVLIDMDEHNDHL